MNQKIKNTLLKKIHTQASSLNKEELLLIETSTQLKTELEIAIKMNSTLRALPKDTFTPPPSLTSLIMQKVLEPIYKIWHIILVMLFIIVSPVVLTWESSLFGNILEEHMLLTIFIYYGILVTLLLLPLSFQIINKHKHEIDDLQTHVDEYLDSKLDKGKRVGNKEK